MQPGTLFSERHLITRPNQQLNTTVHRVWRGATQQHRTAAVPMHASDALYMLNTIIVRSFDQSILQGSKRKHTHRCFLTPAYCLVLSQETAN